MRSVLGNPLFNDVREMRVGLSSGRHPGAGCGHHTGAYLKYHHSPTLCLIQINTDITVSGTLLMYMVVELKEVEM